MILAIITAYLAYKRAVDNGRSGILWAVIGALTFIGTQLAVAFGIGIILGIGVETGRWPETVYDDYSAPVTVVAIIASLAASWMLLRYLEKSPAAEIDATPPPPPPTFDQEK